MSQPIPHNSIRPLTVGERVQIRPQWQDAGDGNFERTVIEAPPNSQRVLIRTTIPGMAINPTETIEASHLERVIDLGCYGDMPPETVIKEHLGKLPKELRLFLVEKFPDQVMETGQYTPEEADLCAQLHPSIALRRAADHLTDERIRQIAEIQPFATLLYASHRLPPDALRAFTTTHPGSCIIILEKHPESGLRYALRALPGDINPNVAQALDAVSRPGG